MNKERLFLDTVFIQAILNKRDQHHLQAMKLLNRVRKADEVWLTEAILKVFVFSKFATIGIAFPMINSKEQKLLPVQFNWGARIRT